MSKHTPGPWETRAGGRDAVFTAAGSRIALVMPRFEDEHRESAEDFANARLIAAAPDLLAALEELMYARTEKAEAMANAAIAKATT